MDKCPIKPDNLLNVEIQLECIEPHQYYRESEIIEFLICEEFSLRNASHHITQFTLSCLLELHPIYVVSASGDKFECVGGLRSLSIARQCMQPTDRISVKFIQSLSGDDAHILCLTDLFIMSTSFNWTSNESAYRGVRLIPEQIFETLTVNCKKQSDIARLLNVSPASIQQWSKKKH